MWALLVVLAQSPEVSDAGVSRELAEKVMTETPQAELIAMGRESVKALGTYRYKMAKEERVNGELLPVQDIEMYVQEKPFAVRLHYVGGPGKGRKVLYNPKERPDDFRVREHGFLGVFGAVWISVESGMAKKDSNHTVKEAGMGPLLERFSADLKKAEGIGGMKITQEGWDKAGKWCTVYTAPNGGKGFSAAKSRICTDVETRLPARVEGFDSGGALLERYVFTEFRGAVHPPKFFDSDGF
ncbi:MAG: DUF1571 domain-containing protein [Myxococcaceae bacterium]|nr:DUF1571 domain-containing protein [Myxococcaceae bacterium]